MLPQLSKELQRNTRPVRHPWSSVLTVANVDALGANVQVPLTVSAATSVRKRTIPPRIQEEGKLYTDCEGPSRGDTNARGLSCQPSGSLATTRSATAGSSRVDVETAVNIKGPLGFGLSAFLMGQSSTALEGILVLPGLIDADYCGTVKIMIHVLIPPVSIPKGTRIAQLVPFRSCVPNPGEVQRGDGGFGSTGKPQYWVCLKKLRRTTAQPTVLHDLLDFVICGEFIMVPVFHIFPQDRLLSNGPTKP
ncbi:deoxyuridine 5'-triphosphate nucleotidohydrolase-like [Accipiter gentilis]|uniref:deoxyuridine 5'-triphosphate nucleotidohydrolase-like n=1 Tax=Astur gentilis TaxID=8957 RepID=UPI00210FC25D|nr:deoxyuridine 5'-triphosphate nucleotidohydrolase-like [Accipiter gentilis]